jgi:2-dehydro-3-deoxygluconokinase
MTVLTIGEAMAMVTPRTPQPLETATEFRIEVGGAESNVAVHLAQLGHPAMWASAVGDDPLGRRVLTWLTDRGVDTSLVRVDPGAPTGVYFKDPDTAGTRVWYYRRGSAAARLDPSFADGLPLDDVELIHVSGITAGISASARAMLDTVLAAAAARDVIVSFDVNFRPGLWSAATAAPVLLSLGRRCDVVFVGRDEAEVLWGTADAEQVLALFDGPSHVVVKDGATGAYAFVDHEASFVPSLAVEVVEAVGAGDAFAAGYLSVMLDGQSPDAGLARGHEMAAVALATTADS